MTAQLSLPSSVHAQGLLGQVFKPLTEAPTAEATPDTTDSKLPAKAAPGPRSRAEPRASRPPPPPKKVAWKAPLNPPLPPPRPPDDPTGSVDVEKQVATEIVSQRPAAPESVDTARPAAEEPLGVQASGMQPATQPQTTPRQASGTRSMVLIVRDGVRGPEDLEGHRIATGLSSAAPDDVRRMVEQSAGVNVNPVAIGWSAGLASLARGEIDGVLLSLGPGIAPRDTEGVTLAGYQLLEIPLSSDAP